ncbi:hypothetical protein WJX81_006444, partial [Elliptochloris bilobata]
MVPLRRLQTGIFDVSSRHQTVGRTRKRLEQMSHAESCDFALKDTDVEREVRMRRGERHIGRAGTWRWVLVLLTGLTMGLLSFALNLAASSLTLLRFRLATTLIQETGTLAAPFCVFVGLAALYGAAASAVVVFFAPQAAGSGLAEMRAYFNGVHVSGLLSMKTFFVKLVSAVFVLAAGLVAEGESPFVHVGAIVGGGLSSLGSRSLTRATKGRWKAKLPRWAGGWFRSEVEHRDMTAVGAASGLAVAFVAPLAGVLLIAEQSAANLGEAVYWRVLLATSAAVLALNVLVAAYTAGASFWDARLLYTFMPDNAPALAAYRVRLWELPAFAGVGALLGAVSAAFVAVNANLIYSARQRWISPTSRFRRMSEVVFLAALTAAVWLSLCYASPCAPTPPPRRQAALAPAPIPSSLYMFGEYSLYPQLWCPPGYYSQYGQLFFAPSRLTLRRTVGVDAVSAEDRASDTLFNLRALSLYAMATTVMLTLTYGAGAALGVVTPTLQVGAVAGLLMCHLVRAAAAAAGYAGAPASLPVYGVVGAGATLSGCLRYKATAVLITVEATGAWSLIVPVVISVFAAELVADRLSSGLFDAYLHLACTPFLADPGAAPGVAYACDRLSVADVMATGVHALPPVIAVAEVVHALSGTTFSTFPVTEEVDLAARAGAEFHVLGIIERQTLLKMLLQRIGLVPGPGGQAAILGALSAGDLAAWVDLRPFMFRSPLLVQGGASLTRALVLFRGLGLRHLLVAPQDPRSVGIITRKDLTLENAQLVLAQQ